MDLFDLSADVAVVIGGTGILGGAIAEGLAAAGARVAIVGRNAQRGESRADTIRQAGGQAEFFAADTLERTSLVDCQKRLETVFGPATVLVNGAGGTEPAANVGAHLSFEQLPLDAWTRNFNLNLVGGALLPCQVLVSGIV